MAEDKTPNFEQLMKTAQEMQKNMQRIHDELAKTHVSGESGGGIVHVTLNGRHECVRINLENSAIAEGKGVLEDLIAAAFNDAVKKVETASRNKLAKMSQELGLPEGGFPGIGGGKKEE